MNRQGMFVCGKGITVDSGTRKGRENERRVIEALKVLRSDPWFWWLWDVRPCTPREDARGIDAVLTSEIGNIWVQVKTKGREAQRFRKRGRERGDDVRDMAIVIAKDRDDMLVSQLKRELVRVHEYRVGEPPERLASQSNSETKEGT